jgi:hypothetical protein
MTNYITTDEAGLRYSEPPKNIEDPLLDFVPGIAWYTNRKLQSYLTVNDNKSY